MAQGDLDAVLDGISETVYENTVSVAQLKSTTGPELVREVQNYMASYPGSRRQLRRSGTDHADAENGQKGYQVQAETKEKENQKGKGKNVPEWSICRQELEELQEKEARVSGQEKSFYIAATEAGSVIWKRGSQRFTRKRKIGVG